MNLFTKYLKTHLAKSDGTTIWEHIQDLKKQFEIFLSVYPEVLTETEKRILNYAIQFHDYGKLNRLFQCKLPVKARPVRCETGEKNDIVPHQYLSPLFLRALEKELSKYQLIILIYSIINHHSRGRERYFNQYGVNLLLEDIEENIKNFFKHIGITGLSKETKEFYKRYFEEIVSRVADVEKLNKSFDTNPQFIKSLIKVAGLLIRIDHSASGEDLIVEEEPIKKDRTEIFLNYLEKNDKPKKLRPFQEKFKDFENLVLVADTGLGKTGLATVWSKRKLFYVLPNRTSTNAMFETMKSIFGKDKVGLLHSTSLFYIYQNRDADIEDYTVLREFENTRNLSKPITISTADQLFTAVFKYPTYEKIYSTLSYSDIVIDEIQGFDPAQIVPIIYQIKETTKIGARYLIITATLPKIIKDEFEKIGFTIKTDEKETIDRTKRHKVCILEKDINSVSDLIIQKAKEGKNVLVILNTVPSAQDFYEKLNYKNKNLLHSRFIWKTRKDKEEKIKTDYQNNKGVIWITTQLVEASLDIDYDVLFTEIAPADSLIQRMGRVWRHKKYDYSLKEPNVYILTEVDEKRVSKVYEKVLRDESLKLIKKFLDKDGFLNSIEKRKIVETLYSKETLERLNSRYFEKWREIEKVLKSNWDYLFKREAQQIFRDTFTFEAIPYIYREKAIKLNEELENLKTIKDKKERRLKRIEILKQINDIKVPIPIYWIINDNIKNKSPYEILNKDYEIFTLAKYFIYDDELGIRLDKELLENYGLDDDIFL